MTMAIIMILFFLFMMILGLYLVNYLVEKTNIWGWVKKLLPLLLMGAYIGYIMGIIFHIRLILVLLFTQRLY